MTRTTLSLLVILATVSLLSCYRNTRSTGPQIVAPTTQGGPIIWRHFSTANDPVKTMTMDGPNLWMGTSRGLIRFNTQNGDYQTYSPRSTGGGIVSRGIYVIRVDPKGNKWVGTYGGGLSKFDGTTWTHYTSAEGLGDNWVYDLLFDKTGAMWVATWDGVSVFDGTTFKTYRVKDGLPDKWVYTLSLDHDNVLWFGTESGVSRFDGATWTTYTHKDGIGADVASDAGGGTAQFPVGTTPPASSGGAEGGDNYGSSSSAHHHMNLEKQNTGPNPNFIISSLVDNQNRKWFGTWGAGVSRYDGKTWTTFTKDQGLGGNYVLRLALDPQGHVWVGTDGGASWFDGTHWHTISTAQGLPSNYVFSILFDDRGHRWFGTLNGLSVFRGALPG
jgi:ligand-binding sensor domain-containing protein